MHACVCVPKKSTEGTKADVCSARGLSRLLHASQKFKHFEKTFQETNLVEKMVSKIHKLRPIFITFVKDCKAAGNKFVNAPNCPTTHTHTLFTTP